MKRNAVFAFIAIVFMACQESLEDRCARECKAYTEKKCPARIGDNTMIDSLVFNKDTHTLSYHYTLSGNADSKEQVMALDAKDLLTKQLRNDPSTKTYKDAGYSFRYVYHSEKDKGEILVEVTITEKDYK